jgi:hypothetical protein
MVLFICTYFVPSGHHNFDQFVKSWGEGQGIALGVGEGKDKY